MNEEVMIRSTVQRVNGQTDSTHEKVGGEDQSKGPSTLSNTNSNLHQLQPQPSSDQQSDRLISTPQPSSAIRTPTQAVTPTRRINPQSDQPQRPRIEQLKPLVEPISSQNSISRRSSNLQWSANSPVGTISHQSPLNNTPRSSTRTTHHHHHHHHHHPNRHHNHEPLLAQGQQSPLDLRSRQLAADEAAASALLAGVDLEDALKFVQNRSSNLRSTASSSSGSSKIPSLHHPDLSQQPSSVPAPARLTDESRPATDHENQNHHLSSNLGSKGSNLSSEFGILRRQPAVEDRSRSTEGNHESESHPKRPIYPALSFNNNRLRSTNLSSDLSTNRSKSRRRIKSMSISLLKGVGIRQEPSPSPEIRSPASPSLALQDLPLSLRSIFDDSQFALVERETARPYFSVDIRSLAAAAERHKANPNQIRRVEECKRFFSLRYEPIFTALAEGRPPTSLARVAQWREKMYLVLVMRQRRGATNSLSKHSEDARRSVEISDCDSQAEPFGPTVCSPLNLFDYQPKSSYKWTCLSSRRYRTVWEICPEDLEAYIRCKGVVEGEAEMLEEDQFGRFDEDSHTLPRHSRRQLKGSPTKRRTDENSQTSLMSFSNSESLPQSLCELSSSNLSHSSSHSHIRYSVQSSPSAPQTDNRHLSSEIRRLHSASSDLDRNEAYLLKTDLRLPTVSRRSPHSSLPSSLQLESDPERWNSSRNSAGSRVVQGLILETDNLNLPHGKHLLVTSPQVSSAVTSSNSNFRSPRLQLSNLRRDGRKSPNKKKKVHLSIGSSPGPVPSSPGRTSSEPDPSPQSLKPGLPFNRSKALKSHSAFLGAEFSDRAGTGDGLILASSKRTRSIAVTDAEKSETQQATRSQTVQKKLMNLARGTNNDQVPRPTVLLEKPHCNLSRNSSSKALLTFTKRSWPVESTLEPSECVEQRQLDPRTIKVSFLHRPPRDWLGWKFDGTTIFTRSNEKKSRTMSEKQALVSDLLIYSPNQPVKSCLPFLGSLTDKNILIEKESQAQSNLCALDLTDEEIKRLEDQKLIVSNFLSDSESILNEAIGYCKRYEKALPKLRHELGLSKIQLPNIDLEPLSFEERDVLSSVDSCASTTTGRSVISRSSSDGETMDVQQSLSKRLNLIEDILNELENQKRVLVEDFKMLIQARRNTIEKYEKFLEACNERQEYIRQDRELLNSIKKRVKRFNQEGKMLDNLILQVSNGISRPLIMYIVRFLTSVIGLSLKLVSIHLKFYRNPIRGILTTMIVRLIVEGYLIVWSGGERGDVMSRIVKAVVGTKLRSVATRALGEEREGGVFLNVYEENGHDGTDLDGIGAERWSDGDLSSFDLGQGV
ncbi:hypothetical protein BY996DRAFT_8685864 [Phakopsora pachyrhizi]|nr:hypothetical protein BY996DRAFT_8685864 [Phakopsora pachyrhizi]